VTEIYAAGEDPIEGVSGRALFEAIRQFGHKNVLFEPTLNQIPSRLAEILLPKDMLLVLGAGNIGRIIPETIRLLRGENDHGR